MRLLSVVSALLVLWLVPPAHAFQGAGSATHQRRGAGDDTVTASAAAGGAIPSAFRRRQASKFRSLFNFPAVFRWALLHTCS